MRTRINTNATTTTAASKALHRSPTVVAARPGTAGCHDRGSDRADFVLERTNYVLDVVDCMAYYGACKTGGLTVRTTRER